MENVRLENELHAAAEAYVDTAYFNAPDALRESIVGAFLAGSMTAQLHWHDKLLNKPLIQLLDDVKSEATSAANQLQGTQDDG